ncbi:MAG: methyltransferase domain-containing protein [Bacteroidota bacterium]
MEKEWFASWFDSPYYHILYKHRDDTEAKHFINTLINKLQPQPLAYMLDLACGKGRHSRYLASLGFCVTGIDLSTENIKFARQFEGEHLSFYTHDMRHPFRINYYEFIFNFFTSFGYFENDKDHIDSLVNVQKGLQKGGIFVLDYLNAEKVAQTMRYKREKTVDGIHFQMRSSVEKGYITKQIHFEDKGQQYQFEERVRAFGLEDFKQMMKTAELKIEGCYGDYSLNPYEPRQSDRLIIIARKEL